ncbi:hypothetical protein QK292_00005 [Arthrobacter sp. AL08]|uniref:hypothetical protein n=1 Tax=Micrococcaceae TaxID=1268 RepID=UPI00249BE0D1|nr:MULTISPECIES: hypothetical protein [Micrococcaceae]MDI3239948.1 hypothetical protein [Arthrobacter sp. AL05]MDI3275958.1 hypothetical protein [Arthrobacter sp. AL08]MDJ0352715.1 hypothetical protein [Pseudarthrobacter sp. PH31-O2]
MILHDDWAHLIGATVEIRRQGKTVRTGRVDHATKDSNILWLAQDGNNPRKMIDKAQGYEAWKVSAFRH